MLLPLILRSIVPVVSAWVQAIMNRERKDGKKVERQIEHKKNYECGSAVGCCLEIVR